MPKFLIRACEGYTPSKGGLYISELKSELSKLYPHLSNQIKRMRRNELTKFCQDQQEIKSNINNSKKYYFKPDSPLNEQEKKYCRCVAHVSSKGSAYNPYAVCTKSVGRTGSVSCAPYYDYANIPKEEVEGLAKLKKKSVEELSGNIK